MDSIVQKTQYMGFEIREHQTNCSKQLRYFTVSQVAGGLWRIATFEEAKRIIDKVIHSPKLRMKLSGKNAN